MVAPFDKLVDFLVYLLEQADHVVRDGETITFLDSCAEIVEPSVLNNQISREFPQLAPRISFLQQVAVQYDGALSGEIPAIGVLYPGGSTEAIHDAESAASECGYEEYYCRKIAALIDAIADQRARAGGSQRLRILEVGGGNGILTELLLPSLQHAAQRLELEYTFSDLGNFFVRKAERKSQEVGLDFMRFVRFDLTADPGPQEIEAGSFDLILALNVVHATPNLRASTARLRDLLVPGGILAMVETTRVVDSTHLIWGLAEGWWQPGEPGLRTLTPLLDADTWEQLFTDEPGWSELTIEPTGTDDRQERDSCLILAQRAASVPALDADRITTGTEKPSIRVDSVDPAIVDRMRRLTALEARGAEIITASLDVADHAAMAELVAQAETTWGRVNGVFHLAMDLRGATVMTKIRDDAMAEIRAKAVGALVLAEIFENRPLDFMVYFSSHIGLTGG
ncbi:MAG: KR domain-containing protein, partial [Myxococcota bacterium]